ncbi:hypothetical protein [Nonomuraea turcica]|uniref:hypothetical protein n=1 Tax=Nonomuraea sp. G32 TaxID=3067274 RepID=UPI00273AE8EB|nr:hypothetical protein [Nonomuraea sp. G32]MDP4501006.1 hypothetical protein [Nonomuraea sp. G32]
MAKPHELHDGDIATTPDWNNGRPVRISRVGSAIRWQDVNAREHARQVPAGDTTEVTVKARRGGR